MSAHARLASVRQGYTYSFLDLLTDGKAGAQLLVEAALLGAIAGGIISAVGVVAFDVISNRKMLQDVDLSRVLSQATATLSPNDANKVLP